MAQEPPVAPGSRWPFLLRIAIQTIAWLVMVLAGVRIVGAGSLWLGAVMIALGGLTAILSIRRLRRSTDDRGEGSGDIPSGELRYIIWAAVGLPVVMGIVLLVSVLTRPR